ncbi:MAG: 5,6-dimethylbenzimidazole synthase [Ferroplasma sp.]
MDIYEAIKKRRDVRSWFDSRHVPEPILAKILLAGHYAPSVGYSQPWNFILIKDNDTRMKIKKLVEAARSEFSSTIGPDKRKLFEDIKVEGIMESDLNIAVTCDFDRAGPDIIGRSTIRETSEYSTVLAIENMWLAARSENIGIGWISFFNPEDVKKILGIPENIKLVAYLALGYLRENHEIPELEEKGWRMRENLSKLVYRENWGNSIEKRLSETINRMDI